MADSVITLAQRAIIECSLISGTGVQKYAEPQMQQRIVDAFFLLFDEHFWDRFCTWRQFTLDGVTGLPTATESALAESRDIFGIWPGIGEERLPKLPITKQPYTLSGTTPVFVETVAANPFFRIWPLASTGNVSMRYRVRPTTLRSNYNTEVPFDDLTVIYLAALMRLADDGANPTMIDKANTLYKNRHAQVLAQESTFDVSMNTVASNPLYPTDWYSR